MGFLKDENQDVLNFFQGSSVALLENTFKNWCLMKEVLKATCPSQLRIIFTL